MPKLINIDQATGLPVRRPKPKRYEVAAPGQLVHVDIKKQGRIPDGGGWRAHGRGSMQDRHAGVARDKAARAGAAGSRGYRYLHHAVDDHSRIAYSEILDDERKETAAGFWTRANAFFAGLGVTVTAVMTDNGSCYRSGAFADALGDEVKHKWTRPYRPQTNGKVERFNRTLAVEWAYAKPYASEAERAAAYETWLHHYNHHRPHTGIGGQTPSARVHNVTGKYTRRCSRPWRHGTSISAWAPRRGSSPSPRPSSTWPPRRSRSRCTAASARPSGWRAERVPSPRPPTPSTHPPDS